MNKETFNYILLVFITLIVAIVLSMILKKMLSVFISKYAKKLRTDPTNFSFIHPLLSPVMNISDPLNFQNDFFGTDSKFYLTSGFFGVFFIDYFKYSFLVLFFVGLFFGYMLKTWEFHKSLIIVVFFSVSLYDYIFVYTYPWIYFIIYSRSCFFPGPHPRSRGGQPQLWFFHAPRHWVCLALQQLVVQSLCL